MADTVVSILKNHEASLQQRVNELRAQLEPLTEELARTRLALASVGTTIKQLPASNRPPTAVTAVIDARRPATSFANTLDPTRMTMKQLVRAALRGPHRGGATAVQMLQTFHEWGRTDIIRSSLSPQLSRLKVDGEITLEGMIWRLAENAEPTSVSGAKAPNENGPPEGGPDAGVVSATPLIDRLHALAGAVDGLNHAVASNHPEAVQPSGD